MNGLRLVFYSSKPHLKLGLGGGALLIGSALISFAFPLSSKWLIDNVIPSRDLRQVALFSIVLLSLYLVQSILSSMGSYLSSVYCTRTLRDLQLFLFSRAITLRMEALERFKPGDIASRVLNDIANLRVFLMDNVLYVLRDTLVLICGLAIMGWLYPNLAVVGLGCLCVVFTSSSIIASKAKRRAKSLQQLLGGVLSTCLEPLLNLAVVKSYTLENFFIDKNKKLLHTVALERVNLEMLNTYAGQASFLISSAANILLVWYAGGKAIEGTISLGQLIAVSFVFSQLVGVIQRLATLLMQAKTGAASLERVEELLNIPWESVKTLAGNVKESGSIDFRAVSFSYPNGKQALRDVTISILPGEIVAVVGPNGAGKSTLMKLLLRFYDAQEGDILVGGRSVKTWDLGDLRGFISLVPQENSIFSLTLRENILIGNPHANERDFCEAVSAARLEEFVGKLPEGYESLLLDGGANLSGGERQRIALARAFLRKSPVIVMDEAMSQVDSRSDQLIQNEMSRSANGRTMLIIAHRLSTVLQADRIIVMNEGSFESMGTHRELLDRCELYRTLCESQLMGRDERSGAIETAMWQ